MNKQIYITGGASGIGLQLAKDYLAAGCNVTIFDIQPTETTVALLGRSLTATQRVQGCTLDVSQSQQVADAFATAAEVQRPDIVVHCAGIVIAQAFTEMSEADYTRIITINLLGTRHVAAAAIPLLAHGGQLVFVASMAGLVGCYGYSAYGAAKSGVVGLAEVLRIELKSRGIDVSVVCPPEVETPMVVEERRHRSQETEKLKLLAGTLSVEFAAQEIRAGIEQRRFLIIPGYRAKTLWLTSRILPGVITRGIADVIVRLAGRGQKS